jgi:HlyD family secretion protein
LSHYKIRSFTAALIVAGLVIAIVSGWLIFSSPNQIVEGQFEATRVKVSSKLNGRLDALYVKEGNRVMKGELLVRLSSPELEAKYEQALAAKRAATAQHSKAMSGAREEEVRSVRDQWLKAKSGTEYAEKMFQRTERLFKDGVVAQQKYDEAETQLTLARKTEDTAKAQYDMAMSGARKEDRESAQALLDQASGMVSEVQAYLRETRLASPITGEVADILAEQGELVGQGFPIVTVVDLYDIWVTVNIREDRLANIKMGDILSVKVPALDMKRIQCKVYYISALGDFATWRATKSTGDFDMRTFEVRGTPVEPVADLRPGMTALVDLGDSYALTIKNRKKEIEQKKSSK